MMSDLTREQVIDKLRIAHILGDEHTEALATALLAAWDENERLRDDLESCRKWSVAQTTFTKKLDKRITALRDILATERKVSEWLADKWACDADPREFTADGEESPEGCLEAARKAVSDGTHE